MHTTEDREKLSDEVAVKTIKSMDVCIMYIHDHKKKIYTHNIYIYMCINTHAHIIYKYLIKNTPGVKKGAAKS